jgi:hypothetical protein
MLIVIVRSSHAKESMPNPELMVGHNFENHTAKTLLGKWTVLP